MDIFWLKQTKFTTQYVESDCVFTFYAVCTVQSRRENGFHVNNHDYAKDSGNIEKDNDHDEKSETKSRGASA